MKKLLLILALLPTILFSQNTTEPVTFRLDVNDIMALVPNPDSAQVFIQTNVASWVDIPMEDIGGNGIWRKNIFISYPTGQNIDVFYRFKITSFGNNGLPFTMWEGGNNADTTCLFDPSTQGLAQGDIRQILFPQELINNGTYVNPTGEYKLTHCFNECGNGPCPPPPPDSWVRFAVQYDFWAPQESGFTFVQDSNGDTVLFHEPTQPWEYLDTIVSCNSGDYLVTLNDSYGDGWGSYQSGNLMSPYPEFKMSNDCQGMIFYADSTSLLGFSTLDTLVNILPCAPPISGCTDSMAINYDSSAVIDDGSCQYIEGCMNPNAANYDSTAAQLPNGLIIPGGSCNLNVWGQNYFGIDSADYWSDPSLWSVGARIYVGANQQQWFVDGISPVQSNCNAPAVLVYVVPTEAAADGDLGTFVPGTNVNAVVGEMWMVDPCVFIYGCTQPNALNYNPTAGVDDGSCINIPGCMDSTSANYNPAATLDDGSCGGGGPISCSPGKELVTVEIMLDQYAEEIGWDIYTTGGVLIHEQPIGSYSGLPMGAIVKKYLCIDYGTTIQFTIDDDFGDGLGGAQFGGIDGTWIVYTECDTLSEGIGDFGSTYSEIATVNECVQTPIFGCTDPAYQEFNAMATVDDGSCLTLNVFGCIDSTAFNYDPNATAQLQNPGCMNTLRLTDWADDGWAGSFLVVTQGNNWWGPFTLGPNDLVLDTAIFLNTQEEVKTYFYSFGQSVPTSNQCRFQIINPVGLVISEGGTNSFTDPLLSYNQYGQIYDDNALCGNNCIPRIYGCTDSLAVNYNPLANTTDNSCYYAPGCTDAAYLQYHTQGFVADYDDGSCTTYAIFGCMDTTQFNYDQYATVQWTSVVDQTDPCIPRVFGCLDPTAFNYDPTANTEDYSCIPFIYGCMDMTMWNYDPTANTDNGSCIPFIYGCTDSTALNFDALANTNDGSCIPYLYGCTDSLSINFNPLANTDDGSCIAELLGCTDSTALNYNSLANTDDGSCIPYIYGCTDTSAFNFSITANTDDGSCIPYIYGCMDPTMFNYDITANVDDGSCIPYIYGCTDPTAWNYDSLANTNVGCISYVYGCTDPSAFNYNPQANTDDSTCVPVVIGCTDPTALNYDSLANTNSGCIYPVLGCTDPLAFNYDPNANTDDGSCVPVIIGCTDPTALNYDSLANTNSGCIYPILGCTDPSAFNYDPNANTDDGSCVPVVIGCTDPTALNYDSLANVNNGCIYPVLGCTDPNAFNYDPLANTDDGSCVPFIYGCTDATMFNYCDTCNTDNGSCIPFIYGCTDSTQYNYDPTANTDNGSCIAFIYGCTDNTALNFDPLANTLDNSCCYIGGCTDPSAVNYNSNACYDDGSCITAVLGCTDVSAYNYNPAANVSDSLACLYDAGCYGGPGNPYWLNDGCFAWVIDVDDYCCTNEWDASCQSMYDYCQLGWPTSVDDITSMGIMVYPNPTGDMLNIDTRLEIEVEIYDLTGKLMTRENSKRISLADYPNGVYNLILIYNNKRFNTRVVKQ